MNNRSTKLAARVRKRLEGKTDKMRAMVKSSKPYSFYSDSEFFSDPVGLFQSVEMSASSELQLADHFLIAMPSMENPVFGGAVVYMCEHTDKGALGVIVNKATDLSLDVLLERIDLKRIADAPWPHAEASQSGAVVFGGPVQVERGFVLHSPAENFSSMIKVSSSVNLTTSKDVLERVAAGEGPQRVLVALGYSGWGAGQLEQEIADNGWLTVRADPSVIFDLPIDERFNAAMKLLGVDPALLYCDAGHA